jgi:hypothetical protein
MGIINRMVPHAASPNPNVILMSGIRLAQLEKQMPAQKYRQKMAILTRLIDIMNVFF